MAKRTEVGAAAVREWFAGLSEAERTFIPKGATEAVTLSVGARGKLSEHVVAAYEAATKNRYVAGHVESRKITGKRPDSNGRMRSVTVTATVPEIREWAKTPEAAAAGVKIGARGRVSSATIAAFVARPVAAKAKPVAKAE